MSTYETMSPKTPLRIAVFCGSQTGTGEAHIEAARSLGQSLHDAGAELIYGGGSTGLMGAIANSLLEKSGPQSLHGIIPRGLLGKERPDTNEETSPRMTVVEDLAERKKLMVRLVSEGAPGSGFIALSGGFGTMDELVEMVALRQHGDHNARVGLLNVEGFWDPLLKWMDGAIEAGFVKEKAKGMLAAKGTAEECIAWLKGE